MPLRDAAEVVGALVDKGLTVAVAESLTGGSLCAVLTAVPGASDCVVGAVVAYRACVKRTVLGVEEAVLDTQGPVCDEVALAMADGVRALLGATVGVATTGVAGPDPHGGKQPGSVHIAAVTEEVRLVRGFNFDGDRDAVVAQTREQAMTLLEEIVSRSPHRNRREGEQA